MRLSFLAALALAGTWTIAWLSPLGAQEIKEGNFTTKDGIKIHYLELGQGTPVVLIHGYTSSARGNWFGNNVAQELAKNHRVIALDCRNHGLSDKPQPGARGKADDVVELIDHLKIPKAHFVGYSMGGSITSQLLYMIPDRMLSASFGGSGVREIEPEWIAKLPPDKPDPNPRQRTRSATDANRAASGNAAAGSGGADGPIRPGKELVLVGLTMPMLAVNGEFDAPNDKTTRMKREVKNFKSVTIPGKNHMSAVSDPLLRSSIVEFINANDVKP